MASAWVNLSTKWGLSSVQAALNVIISVAGTAGIWAFSRYSWQRAGMSVLRGNSEVPLSALLSISGPGEGFDAVVVLRRRVFAKENWWLLLQLSVVITATMGCIFSGPIAKVSLRRTSIVQARDLGVRQTVKGDGSLGNFLDGTVQWNDTIQSLNQAGYPITQPLDFLPPVSVPWTYIASEWDPTWRGACEYTDETVISDVTATGNHSFPDPINAFPAYRNTYAKSWLDKSKYRVQADYANWAIVTDDGGLYFKDAFFFIIIQSNPEVDDRMYTNNETLQISISVFHAQNFQSVTNGDATQAGEKSWKPIGSVGNASFARVECNFTRKEAVADEDSIPWIWTNGTYSITYSYRTYWLPHIEDLSSKNLTVTSPTPQELLRFHQAYMASVNTNYAFPSLRRVSMWIETVQLSIVFLVVLIVMTVLALWLTGRYFWFLRKHKKELKKMFIPDGKVEWMIHAAKTAAQGTVEELLRGKEAKDRDYLREAAFGNSTDVTVPNHPRGLARVYTSRSSVHRLKPSSTKDSRSRHAPQPPRISTAISSEFPHGEENEDGTSLKRFPGSVGSSKELELKLSSDCGSVLSYSRDHSPCPNERLLSPPIRRFSSAGGSQVSTHYTGNPSSRSSFRSIVPESEDLKGNEQNRGSDD